MSERESQAGAFSVVAVGLLYGGIALSGASYWYLHERTLVIVRSTLISTIYETSLHGADISKGDTVTLINADVERIRVGLLNLHEIWALSVEVAIASWLLQRHIGVAFIAPIVLVVVCVILSTFLGRIAGHRQRSWLEAIQGRIRQTSNALAGLKSLKMAGLAEPTEAAIRTMRVDKIKAGGRFRMVQATIVAIAFCPAFLSPVLSFAFTPNILDASKMYTTLAYLVLVAAPLAQLIQVVPALAAALTCLRRIQDFILSQHKVDYRTKVQCSSSNGLPMVNITNGSFGWEEQKDVLKGVNLMIPPSCLAIVIGPVASGKSTLCKAILGEVPVARGTVAVEDRAVGYCDQNPFLANTSIKENIIAGSEFDPARYHQVIGATLLDHDFEQLSRGDETVVGNGGINLSGGQQQRVVLARALYLRTKLVIADDILSGLDQNTASKVFWNVFGPHGILKSRGATSILCAHSETFLPLADLIVVLNSQGSVFAAGSHHELLESSMAHDNDESTGLTVNDPEQEPTPSTMTSPTNAESDIAMAKSRQHGGARVYSYYMKTIKPLYLVLFLTGGVVYGLLSNFPTIWLNYWAENHFSRPTAFCISIYAMLQTLALLTLSGNVIITLRSFIKQSGIMLHHRALRAVINSPLIFFSTTEVGKILNHFSQNLNFIDSELPMTVLNVSLDTFAAIGGAAVIASSSPFIVISYPLLLGIVFIVQKCYLRTSRQLRLLELDSRSPVTTHFLDTMSDIITIRSAGNYDATMQSLSRVLDESQQPAYLLAMVQRWLFFAMNVLTAFLSVEVVALATKLPTAANVGLTGASLVSLMTFGELLGNLVRMYTMMETSLGAVSRLKTFSEDMLTEQGSSFQNVSSSWPREGAIKLTNVSATYFQDNNPESTHTIRHLAVKDLNFEIHPGEKVAVVGRTGSGKSTILLLLARLLEPMVAASSDKPSGIFIDGVAINNIEPFTLRKRIIVIPQDTAFIPGGTIKSNIDPYDEATEAECNDALEVMDMLGMARHKGGLHVILEPDELSRGQKQLFSMARAVLRRKIRDRAARSTATTQPLEETSLSTDSAAEKRSATGPTNHHGLSRGVLLLDEPDSGVDADAEKRLWDAIMREFKDYTVVSVSHRFQGIMEFDRVLWMDSGRILESRPPPQVLAKFADNNEAERT